MPVFDCHTYLTVASFSGSMRTREQVLDTMKRFGLDAVALISGLGTTCDFSNGNRILREVLDDEQGLFGYCTLNTTYPDESLQEQRMYLSRREFVGSILIGEPDKPIASGPARDIINAQRRYGKPVVLFTPNSEAVLAARALAEEFTQIKFLLLTMGGEGWRIAVDTAKKCLNVYLEISGSLDSDKITHAANTISARRLVFGSGLPNSDPSLYQGLVEECEILTSVDRKRILIDNALSVFQIHADVE